MQPIFRLAGEADASEIAALVNRAYRPASHASGWTHEADLVSGDRISAGQVLSLLGLQSSILLLCSGSKIIACVHVRVSESIAFIGMLATDPAHQAQGLGKQMLLHAESYARENFPVKSFQMTVLSSRSELVAFYERRGYVRTWRVEDYPLLAGAGVPKRAGLKVELLEKRSDR